MKDATKVKWGIFAASNIAGRFVPDLKTVEGVEVAAVASRDIERATRFAEKHGIGKTYGSYLELVKDPNVQAVYISTLQTSHFENAKLAIEHGKAVLIEKPFTVNAKQAEQLVALARAKKVFLMEAMWTRTYPLLHEIKQIIERGDIGDVTLLHCHLAPIGLPNGFRTFQMELAGGALLECGLYPVNFAHYLLGKPKAMHVNAHLTPAGVDDALSMVFEYPNRATATLSTSVIEGVSSGLPSAAYISGTKGWISVPQDIFAPKEYRLYRVGQPGPVIKTLTAIGSGYAYEAAEASRAIAAGELESPMMPLDTSLELMRLMDEIRQRAGVRYAED